MTERTSLLVELFTEELPPKVLRQLGEAFAEGIRGGLAQAQLTARDAGMQVFTTPRRLGVLIAEVASQAPERSETKKLMPVKVAFDAGGDPTPALAKRLEKEGLTTALDQVERRREGETEYAFVAYTRRSRARCRRAAGRTRSAPRRSDRARRVARRVCRAVRAGVSDGAAGMPDSHHAGESEILSALRFRWQAHQPLSHRQQHAA